MEKTDCEDTEKNLVAYHFVISFVASFKDFFH